MPIPAQKSQSCVCSIWSEVSYPSSPSRVPGQAGSAVCSTVALSPGMWSRSMSSNSRLGAWSSSCSLGPRLLILNPCPLTLIRYSVLHLRLIDTLGGLATISSSQFDQVDEGSNFEVGPFLLAHFPEQFAAGEEPGQRGMFLVLRSFLVECAGAVGSRGDGLAVWQAQYCLFSVGPYARAGVEEVDDFWQGLNGGSNRLRGGGGVPFSEMECQLIL